MMTISIAEIKKYQHWYQDNLVSNIVPFWENHSVDKEYGGYITCLLRDGRVYDTDKFIWLQARQVWTFAKLYNEYEPKAQWLEIALHGAQFLEDYGMDHAGDWYFSVDRAGQPLYAPYNIFSDCFACMGFGQLSIATKERRYGELSRTTYDNILARKNNPKGAYKKSIAETRPSQSFALSMILANLSLEIESLLDSKLLKQTIDSCVDLILNQFYQEDLGVIVENISDDGQLLDTMDGRLVNPGHAIEACWFLMDIGKRMDDQKLIQRAVDISLEMLEYGWDSEYGGIYYFLDIKNRPMQQLEWDQKLWWVHMEAIIATLKGYALTHNERCWQWFERLHDYSWSHFHDKDYGEWYGYLKRDGTLLNSSKGGKWKGCFHMPRGLLYSATTLQQLIDDAVHKHQI